MFHQVWWVGSPCNLYSFQCSPCNFFTLHWCLLWSRFYLLILVTIKFVQFYQSRQGFICHILDSLIYLPSLLSEINVMTSRELYLQYFHFLTLKRISQTRERFSEVWRTNKMASLSQCFGSWRRITTLHLSQAEQGGDGVQCVH